MTKQRGQEAHAIVVEPHVEGCWAGKEVLHVLRVQALQITLQTFFHLPADLGHGIGLDRQVDLKALADIVIALRPCIAP